MKSAIMLTAVLVFSGCYQANEGYTPGLLTCSGDGDCSGATLVCDTANGNVCVQCTKARPQACIGTTPVCGDDRACRACTAHTDCTESQVCLPTGACGTAENVAYVASAAEGGSDNTTCTMISPCTKVAEALKLDKPYLKLTGSISENVLVDIKTTPKTITLLAAPGAKLQAQTTGAVIEIKGSAKVAVYDLEISGGMSTMGHGVWVNGTTATSVELHRVKISTNGGAGIKADPGSVVISRSTISSNLGGGIALNNANFDVTNTLIFLNGTAGGGFGGALFVSPPSGIRRFEFNTVSENVGGSGVTTGVTCAAFAEMSSMSNNIVSNNQTGNGRTQVGGTNCNWTYSVIGPDAVGSNASADPAFDPLRPFHLTALSPAKDAADPAATIAVDFDGDARPQGGRRDIGADELK